MDIFGNKTTIDNPCIGVCSTTYGDEICRGCKRTVEEIRDWNRYSKEQKENINKRLRGDNNENS